MLIENPWFWAAAAPAVLIVGISKGGVGGGLGTVGVPILSLVVDPRIAAAVLLPVLCLIDLMSLKAYWGRWHRLNMRILIAAAMIGILAGALTFRHLDADAIRVLIGVIAILFALRTWLGARRSDRPASAPNALRGGLWGAVAGFTSFVSHNGGPPVAVYLLPQKLDKTLYQATTVVFFAAINYVKLVPYWLLGQFPATNLTVSAALFPLAVAGTLLGVWLHTRISDRLFFIAAYVLLFGIGIKLVYDGMTGLLA